LIQDACIEVIAVVATFFFAVDQPGLDQYLYVVRNRRLCETDHIVQTGAFATTAFAGDVVKDLEAVAVSEGLGYLFDLLEG